MDADLELKIYPLRWIRSFDSIVSVFLSLYVDIVASFCSLSLLQDDMVETGLGSSAIDGPAKSFLDPKTDSDSKNKDDATKECSQISVRNARAFSLMKLDLVVFSCFVYSSTVRSPSEADIASTLSPSEAGI